MSVKPSQNFNRATRKLLKQISEMNLPTTKFLYDYEMGDMLVRFRNLFLNEDLRHDVLSHQYELSRQLNENYSAGFCGIASYTWTQIFRMPDGAPIWRIVQGWYHIWLQNRFDNSVFDITYDQYNFDYPYDVGNPVDEKFKFKRALKFSEYLNIDLDKIVQQNILMSDKSK